MMENREIEALSNIKDVSTMLGIQPNTIRIWAMNKKIPYYKVGGRLKFRLSEIKQWVEDKKYGT